MISHLVTDFLNAVDALCKRVYHLRCLDEVFLTFKVSIDFHLKHSLAYVFFKFGARHHINLVYPILCYQRT